MEFEEFLIDDNSENDVEENIEGNATNSTNNIEGYIRVKSNHICLNRWRMRIIRVTLSKFKSM